MHETDHILKTPVRLEVREIIHSALFGNHIRRSDLRKIHGRLFRQALHGTQKLRNDLFAGFLLSRLITTEDLLLREDLVLIRNKTDILLNGEARFADLLFDLAQTGRDRPVEQQVEKRDDPCGNGRVQEHLFLAG